MQSRLRMAALALVTAVVGLAPAARAGDHAVVNTVNLELEITGVGAEGYQVEIKPGHAACKFKKIEKTIKPGDPGYGTSLKLDPIEVQSTGAERDCSFSITIKEAGRKPTTFRRGLRLTAAEPGDDTPQHALKCYLNTAPIAARETTRPKR